jgi:hypothetical protein
MLLTDALFTTGANYANKKRESAQMARDVRHGGGRE